MTELRLGPVLRYADESTATVWVETGAPCTVQVRCPGGAGGSADTFTVAGHHYALVVVDGLSAGSETPYEVTLGDRKVWPLPDSPFPPSVIRTLHAATADPSPRPTGATAAPESEPPVLRVGFGSCRWAARPAQDSDPVGPDALDALAARAAADPQGPRPDVLVLLGDQVYADETSEQTREWLAARRDLNVEPGAQVADFEEYTRLYHESWLDPEVRWLLSTVPSVMIFDDHDIIDDWNTSAAWLSEVRGRPWWRERILSGFMTYWIHQHLGNLAPHELKNDPVLRAVRASAEDATEVLREFAGRADARVAPRQEDAAGPEESLRWSVRRDFGRVRLLMVDTRAARVLEEESRAMLGPGETAWLRGQLQEARGQVDHLLIGSSLPWLLPHLVHDAETWNASLCRGARGPRQARLGERIRQAGDLEHWAAFPESFTEFSELLAEAGAGEGAPATVCVLSGDVHHSYVAEPSWPASWPEERQPRSRVLQLTCSPLHNSVPGYMRTGFRFGWSRVGRSLGRALLRHARTRSPEFSWRRAGGPWFGNHLMTLTLRGREALLHLEAARPDDGGDTRLEQVQEARLTG